MMVKKSLKGERRPICEYSTPSILRLLLLPQFLDQFEYILSRIAFENVHLKTCLRERLVGPMDDGVVGSQVDALQDVLLRSLVLHIVLIPDDRQNEELDDEFEFFILSTEVYLCVVVYVAPNLQSNWSNIFPPKIKVASHI